MWLDCNPHLAIRKTAGFFSVIRNLRFSKDITQAQTKSLKIIPKYFKD